MHFHHTTYLQVFRFTISSNTDKQKYLKKKYKASKNYAALQKERRKQKREDIHLQQN